MKTKFNVILTLLLVFIVQMAFAQEKIISGVVTDEMGALPGVNIIIDGTAKGTDTDFDGKYTLKTKKGDVLVFSFVGMETKKFTVGTSNKIDIVMTQGNVLEEVVVTAYGTQKKESLTGSVTKVDSKELAKSVTANVVKGLTGKVAGVQIYTNSGKPGSEPVVRFRGIGSLNGSSSPLYVVDGIPFEGSITSLNQNDIASVSFVKDASAAALYGSRGANGVVIITTKAGKKGKVSVSVDVKTSFTERAIEDYQVQDNMPDYLRVYHKMLKNKYIVEAAAANQNVITDAMINKAGVDASTGLFDGDEIGLVYNPYGGDRTTVISPDGEFRGGEALWNENWSDYLFNTGSINSAYISVSGGDDKTKYFLSGGHEQNDGYSFNSGFDRTTIKTNINSEIAKNLTFGIGLNYTKRRVTGDVGTTLEGAFSWVRNVAPIYPVYAIDRNTGERQRDAQGNFIFDTELSALEGEKPRPFNSFGNPYGQQILNKREFNKDNLTTRANVKYKFLNDFSFSYKLGFDVYNSNFKKYSNKTFGSSKNVGGRMRQDYKNSETFTNQQILDWKKSLNGVHNFDVMIGHESYSYEDKNLAVVQVGQFLNGEYTADMFLKPEGAQGVTGGVSQYHLEGYLGRVMYNYDDKYYVNGSFRRDGSSVFHPDNRWGNFYGGGLAWRVSKESFMEDVSWVNELKLKTSFGQLGNDIVYYPGLRDYYTNRIRNYTPYIDQWDVVTNGTSFDLNKNILGNKGLSWEKTTNINAGFEGRFFDNRFSIESEFFIRRVTDMLYNRPLPASTGLPSVPENVMSMENVGVELSLSYDIIKKKDLNWDFSVNATHYKNEITEMVPGKEHIDASGARRWVKGGGAYDFYMRKMVGVNKENGNTIYATTVEFVPGTQDPTNGVTETYAVATEYLTGKSSLPDVYGGFSSKLNYRNFDFAIDFSYQIGGYTNDYVYRNLFKGNVGNNLPQDFSKTWTWDNKDAKLPRVDPDGNNYSTSDFFLKESDYLSLNNITIGYSLPSELLQSIGFQKVRLYGNVNNLGLWTKDGTKGFDPRMGITRGNSQTYANLKTWSLGVNINF